MHNQGLITCNCLLLKIIMCGAKWHGGCFFSGTKERGEMENRMTKLIAETKEAGDVILM